MNPALVFRKSLFNSEISLAVAIIGILTIMLVPLPSYMLDILLAINITVAIIILFVALYTIEPLDFSTFPSVLLISTLFRLSLNIASTRIILLEGNTSEAAAGYIIKAFGTTIVGGDYIVGFILFLILILINFIVITKGAGRIAEVTARFALDAMPGKQMAIDADLNAGIINDKIAQERRQKIQREADFYGSMDGASKFVRGDAIAGLVITLVNIVGGLIIGVLVYQMPFQRAIQQFTILTIGDGLVTQIPALIISTAAGISVSKAGRQNRLGKDFNQQLFGNYRILGLAGLAVLLFIFIPGTPKSPFLGLSVLFFYLSWRGFGVEKTKEQKATDQAQVVEKKAEDVAELLPLDSLGLELGYGLVPLVDTDQDGELLERIKAIRRQIALDLGFIVPSVHIKDNLSLEGGAYSILIKGMEVAKGTVLLNHFLAMKSGEEGAEIEGEKTVEPAFGLPAVWIFEQNREQAQLEGYTVVDIPTVMTTHITEVIKTHAHEFLQRQDVQKLLDQVAQTQPKLVEDLVPNVLNLGIVQRVLQGLLKEGIPIRDLVTILETLADYAPQTKSPDMLLELVRQNLSKVITHQYMNPESVLTVMTLQPGLEKILNEGVQETQFGNYFSLEPEVARKILQKIQDSMQNFQKLGLQAIILCGPKIRPHLKKLVERSIPGLVVLSHNEVSFDAKIENLGSLSI